MYTHVPWVIVIIEMVKSWFAAAIPSSLSYLLIYRRAAHKLQSKPIVYGTSEVVPKPGVIGWVARTLLSVSLVMSQQHLGMSTFDLHGLLLG